MDNNYLKIPRRKLFSFNRKIILQNSFSRNLTIQAKIGNGIIFSDDRPLIKIINYKEIFIDEV